ncbi:putative Phox domain, PX domain superfamily protein [Helianthus annuus]|uniref:Phox domain, PX domain superfamily, sorting nexin n=1 Tax=Helianthus annuus TaxID=4232 RepID=A0A251VKW2_HELAN|nr:PX domain-containing protein EREX [Helianthus annuus]KAF5793157.1 putative Phox domain, PX domain superfamily, sorting nexin [Helianthus annuus]KAJ0528012.1 putative PX domain-containing protein EREX [Helianthus annuus]KAJ0536864.1 putative Phox domain, PX domain superfamily protein [Helianthus annuus]KAJ0544446.1 putative PX domain-containing protein EREX [Helianthus annuus]KAJ0709449.1 putative PX domain-containing protein EREX [Helianthus annuus]
MSMYGFDASFYDYGFSDPAITRSFYGNPIDFDDDLYFRRRPPVIRQTPPTETLPEQKRHDGTSPLPLGMDWSLPPRLWEGRNTVWPHDSHKKWSYCVTVPSWTIEADGSDTVFFKVQVGIQSPEGITSTRQVPRRFNEFLKLYSELKKEFPKKNLPPAPPKRLTKMRSKTLLEERRCALEVWMEKLLSDVNVSRTVFVAIFLELEAAARQSCSELNLDGSAATSVPSDQFLSNATSLIGSSSSVTSDLENRCADETSEDQNHGEPNMVRERSSDMQWDWEELTRKCMELELRLTIEQDARAYAESFAATIIQQNEMLRKELDDVKKQVKSLETSHSELEQELNKRLKDKVELENEKQEGRLETLIKETVEACTTMTDETTIS